MKPTAQLAIVEVSELQQMQKALEVRRSVFIEEQRVPEDLEIDEYDRDPGFVTSAVHVLALAGEVPVATGRLLLEHEDGRVHIGRVAVLREYRGSGYGRAVMEALHQTARNRGVFDITLAAQLHALGFYERLGYTAHGDVFMDAGIEHRWMNIRLKNG